MCNESKLWGSGALGPESHEGNLYTPYYYYTYIDYPLYIVCG